MYLDLILDLILEINNSSIDFIIVLYIDRKSFQLVVHSLIVRIMLIIDFIRARVSM